VIGMVNPFSGPLAEFGQEMTAGCEAAISLVNAHGGVLGHQLHCAAVDTKGSPAAAVPAVAKAIASLGMAGVMGPGTDAATATVPLLNRAKIPMIGGNTDASFDRSPYQYYWRILPAADTNAVAMAAAAHRLGYTRAAMVFSSSPNSQAFVPALLRSFPKFGGRIVVNEKITPDQPSYRAQMAKLVAAHPQVIFTASDPPTGGTMFGELKRLGTMFPIIAIGGTTVPPWYWAVRHAIGLTALLKYYQAVNAHTPTSGYSWNIFDHALLAVRGVPDPGSHARSPYCQSYYDDVNMLALAMIAAKSTSGPKYDRFLRTVTQPDPAATVVHTFAQGVAALRAGKPIRYVGAVGPVDFDRWRNSIVGFQVVRFTGAGPVTKPVLLISPAQLSA
jgi:branched-chain amino acid transport system substrate-binding protein